MQHTLKPLHRNFLPQDFCLKSREDILPYFQQLLQTSLDSLEVTLQRIAQRDEYEACLSEAYCRADIDYARFLEDSNLEKAYFRFIETIQPEWMKMSDLLNKHLMTSTALGELKIMDGYRIMIRGIENQISLFREENIPLFEQEQKLCSEYSKLRGAMTIDYDGKTLTLNQASVYLESQDRNIRETVYRLTSTRQTQDIESINIVLDKLITLRHQIAQNAGCKDYIDYSYRAKNRFDYGVAEVIDFHAGVEKVITPRCQQFLETRQKSLDLDVVKPYDLAVDIRGREPLQAFAGEEQAIDRTIACLDAMDQDFGNVLRKMKDYGHFDLESRTGKRGGAFISRSQYETKIPYMFGNLVGTLGDISTMIHESGHAIHGQMMHDSLALNAFSDVPSEIAEIGSMALELLSMEHRGVFKIDPQRLQEAQEDQIQDAIEVLAWISCIDSFQHWLYGNIGHSHSERAEKWLAIYDRYKTSFVDFSDFEMSKAHLRQKQVHIFEYPFYYIEYGIAQLASFALYAQYKQDKDLAFANYKKILALGYTKTMPEIFEAGGIEWGFGEEVMKNLL